MARVKKCGKCGFDLSEVEVGGLCPACFGDPCVPERSAALAATSAAQSESFSADEIKAEPLHCPAEGCSAILKPGVTQCGQCGTSVSTAKAGQPTPIFVEIAGTTAELPPGCLIDIGRRQGSSQFAEALAALPQVSRDHARLERREDGTLWIIDVGSLNGTFVADLELEPDQPARIDPGVPIRLASDEPVPIELWAGSPTKARESS